MVTVRVATLKGAEAGRYYTERLSSYYLDGGEPSGRWWGQGARDLALEGDVDAVGFLAVMAGRDPDTGKDLGRGFGEMSVRGFDATFSAPKSVSLLWALGDQQTQAAVLEAHDRAVDAVLGWVEDHAHTRLRRQGHVVCVDAEGLIVGVFRQHTSRRLDPQLHTHAVIANRVRSPDGRWLALDARTIKIDQRTLSSLYHADLRSELTSRLGVEWRTPEHGIAEIDGIPDEVLAEFSQRTRDVDQRLARKLERFERSMGRPPSDRERWQLEREAVLDSRPAKPHGAALAELRNGWRRRTVELGHHPEQLVSRAVGRRRTPIAVDVQAMVEQALQSLGDRQSSWRSAELLRELASATPTDTTIPSAELTRFLESAADQVTEERCVDISGPIPGGVELRRDGRPVTEPAVDRALTTRSILEEEEGLVAWAHDRMTTQPDTSRPWVTLDRRGLSDGQAAAVSVVVGSGGLELMVGPAGAGKTTALAHAVDILRTQERAVFGVAPTAAAAEVLGTEAGMRADTLDKLLYEHTHPTRPPSLEYDLAAGTTLIVDEAGTVSTPKLAQLAQLADKKRWRVVLVGDPRQLAAVGRGGMFGHLVNTFGAVELDEVHRFTHQWETRASLRLRAGDPLAVSEYDQHGRIHAGSVDQIEPQILGAWMTARQRGETVALMANSNQTVNRLNQQCQQLLADTGHIDPGGRSTRSGTQTLHEGDEVVTRLNNRTLQTDQRFMVKNRDHWTIQHIHSDGAITVAGATGQVTLPADYAAQHVELGYAQTSHTSQGRTVDTALLYIDGPTDRPGIYTPMTRGRHSNHAYIAVDENQNAADVLAYAITREWADQPAVARQSGLERAFKRPLPVQEQTLESIWGLEQTRHSRTQDRGSKGLEL
ncbi:MAG TPA: MobF family relaxase [Acidimicrobiia bacterium]|nr:MobF family relaxase [Acidimicrobiia bacterium]